MFWLEDWKFHAGDNPEWASPAWDDTPWETRSPLLEAPEGSGIGWFRARFVVDDRLADDILVLTFEQIGASDIYIDGLRVGGFGIVSTSAHEEVREVHHGRGQTIALSLRGGEHVVAVRYSDHTFDVYPWLAWTHEVPPGFRLGFATLDNTLSGGRTTSRKITTLQMLWGMPFALAILHYLIYLFNRQERAHLDYGLFAEATAGMVFFPFQAGYESWPPWVLICTILFKVSLICSGYFGLRFVHRAFDQSPPRYLRVLGKLTLFLSLLAWALPVIVYFLAVLVGFFAMLVIVYKACRQGCEGGKIIGAGCIILTLFSTIQVLIETGVLPQTLTYPYIYGILALTLSMSVHLARNFASTHGALQLRLEEIESLTGLAIEQERENRERESAVRERAAERLLLEAENSARAAELDEARRRQQVLEELEASNHELRDAQSRLVQTERMAAIGNLVAGIAHEINTPVGAIYSSHDTFVRGVERLSERLQDGYTEASQRVQPVLRVIADADRVIATGTQRVTEIVRSLRNFARLDEAEMMQADLHDGLDSTLTLVHHELKNRIEVEKDYGQVPLVLCYPSRLNQVFLNLLVNASQAIEGEGRITIRTNHQGDTVSVEIQDSGRGMPEDILPHIFESGFTTKAEGEGTGLGLAISRQIVDDHGGQIEVASLQGEGTTFRVILPVGGSTDKAKVL